MNNYALALVAVIVLEMLLCVGRIGRPRKPLSPPEAIGQLVEWGITLWLLWEATR